MDVLKCGRAWLCLASLALGVRSFTLTAAEAPEPKPAPGESGVVAPEKDHKIAPLEVIIVEVFGERDLSKECAVQASGIISYPLLGEVKVAGRTTGEVERHLTELLGKDFLVNPQVTVSVKQYRLRKVNVLGEVTRPGAIELLGEQKWTILDAISQAGGLTRAAAKNRVEFTRQGRMQRFSFEELKKISDPAKMIYVEPGDTIFIPQSIW